MSMPLESHGVGKSALAVDCLELFPCAAGILIWAITVADFPKLNPKVLLKIGSEEIAQRG